jgi:hypothetical protein
MNRTEAETPVPDEADPEAEYEQLSTELLSNTWSLGQQVAVQALVEEQTILSLPAVQRRLIVDSRKGRYAYFRAVSGLIPQLGLDEEQCLFLYLVMMLAGLGVAHPADVALLDERRQQIITRALETTRQAASGEGRG